MTANNYKRNVHCQRQIVRLRHTAGASDSRCLDELEEGALSVRLVKLHPQRQAKVHGAKLKRTHERDRSVVETEVV